MQHIGKSKIGSLSARKGVRYPQLRLPQQCSDLIGDTADIFETERDGKRAFLIVPDLAVPKGGSVLKQCADLAQPSAEVSAKNDYQATQQSEPDSRSKSTAESFIIDTWLVSCAASGSRFACVSPGSVAAYHGALSRLRLGFKSRLGRFIFGFSLPIEASRSS